MITTARFDTRCPVCKGRIGVGQNIGFNRENKPVHESCLPREQVRWFATIAERDTFIAQRFPDRKADDLVPGFYALPGDHFLTVMHRKVRWTE